MKIFQIYTLDSSALNTSGIPGNGMSQCTVCSLLVLAEYYSCPPALTPTGVWSPRQSQPNQTNVRTSYRHRSNTLARPCRQAPARRLLDNGKSQRNFRSSAHDLCDYAAQKRGKGKMSRLWIQPSCLHYLQVAGAEPLIIDRSKAHSEGSLLPWLGLTGVAHHDFVIDSMAHHHGSSWALPPSSTGRGPCVAGRAVWLRPCLDLLIGRSPCLAPYHLHSLVAPLPTQSSTAH